MFRDNFVLYENLLNFKSVVMKKSLRVVGSLIGLMGLVSCSTTERGSVATQPYPPPEVRARVEGDLITVNPRVRAVATASPFASRAALRILAEGGNATDAAIAAQMVLGLVEPQSSGIGGGALVMYWDAKTGKLSSYDGLAAAPARVTAALRQDFDGKTLKADDVARGGRSVGVPGNLAVLNMLHQRHGKLAWSRLFQPAIELATAGFPLPKYLHGILATPTGAADHPQMMALYFGPDAKVLPVGTMIKNPEYAKTLGKIATVGSERFLKEGGAAAIVKAAQAGSYPSAMTEADILNYRAEVREPLCAPFLAYRVCAMGPTSFGGVVVLQMLQMLEARMDPNLGNNRFNFSNADFLHVYAEAGRLAQADRLTYIGDPAFAPMPTTDLISGDYLKRRAGLIHSMQRAASVEAGKLPIRTSNLDQHGSEVADATSQIAIADDQGNSISLTTTNNLNFGSRIMVDGYVLNNAMTNFSALPAPDSAPPNRMQSGKRPVTSMAPVIVFDSNGRPVVVGGSAGGGQIVDYITGSLVEMLANQKTPAQALARGNISSAIQGTLQLEKDSPIAAFEAALASRGHKVQVLALPSGQGFLKRQGAGWLGAADPRRDGLALGH